MDEARRLWYEGRSKRLWIVADEQTSGRGRQGRTWTSPAGNLHLTLLTPTIAPLRDQPKLGFAAGVALASAVSKLIPTGQDVRLKWPNDLLVNGAKAGGVLLEGLGGGAAVAIGIGANIVAHPPDTSYAATHLRLVAPGITRDSLFAELSLAMRDELEGFGDGGGFSRLRERWLGLAAHLGQSISIGHGLRRMNGVFQTIDDDGRLVLETSAGLVRIDAGDVFPLDNLPAALQERGDTDRTSAA